MQCALISKAWHRKVVPVLWANIRDLSPAQQASFQQLVLQDYRAAIAMDIREQRLGDLLRNNDQTVRDYCQMQQQLLWSDHDDTNTRLCALVVQESDEIQEQLAGLIAERVQQMLQLRPPTTLVKYGCWVSKTPDIPTLMTYLWPEKDREPYLQNVQQGRGGRAPSKYDMLRHFLERCPHIRFPSLVITQAYIDDGSFMDYLAMRVLPSVQELVLDSLSLSFSNLRKILEAIGRLRSLDIRISRIRLDEERPGAAQTIDDIQWFKGGLTHLTMSIQDRNHPAEFWTGLWRGYENVQFLRIIEVVPGMVAALTRDVAVHMPHMISLDLGYATELVSPLDFSDEHIATILAAGTAGWRSIQLRDTAAMVHRSLAALAQHYATLEVLDCCWSFRGEHLVNILLSCPNLSRLTCQIEDVRQDADKSCSPVTVKQFIDWDEETLSYRPWACEDALRTLQIVFVDLDQADDSWGLHVMLYGRLSRLIQLEVLHLGTVGESQLPSCGIAMTLTSGLSMLAVLTKLRTLDLSYMVHQVKIQDLEWMVEYWPNLISVKGLDPQEDAWMKNILKNKYDV
ncbi:hypothetical protein BGZ93_007400 [Podila epicladia]|nr:hypothetical protein BGZ93_007400 [Podila epicladia]